MSIEIILAILFIYGVFLFGIIYFLRQLNKFYEKYKTQYTNYQGGVIAGTVAGLVAYFLSEIGKYLKEGGISFSKIGFSSIIFLFIAVVVIWIGAVFYLNTASKAPREERFKS